MELNYKQKYLEYPVTWTLNNTFLNNPQVEEEIKSEVRKYKLEMNKNTTYKNMWDAAKAVFRCTLKNETPIL